MRQANELSLMKNQSRRKHPKIAPFVVIVVLIVTIVPIYYYPFLNYPNKYISSTSSHQSITFEASIKEQEPHSFSTPCDYDDMPPDKIKNCARKNTYVEKSPVINSKSTQLRRGEVATEGRAKAVNATERSRSDLDRDVTRIQLNEVKERRACNIFSGEWIPDPNGPYYTNDTCWAIQEHQNCMKFGKPGPNYLQWRFKPDECELPIFDPFQFMELMRGKSLAFVGDSVARNHMQSLICLLSKVEEPDDVSEVPFGSQFKRYEFKNNNLAIEIFWSPYLVKTTQTDPVDASRPFNLYLDEFDEKWTTKIEKFDYVVISAGHWFFRPTMFYVNGRVVGCLYCPQSTIPHLNSYFSYRRAFRTAFRALNDLPNYKGLTFLRTFAPSHFEGGYWDRGGDCARKRPFKRNETRLKDYNLQLYKIQLDEIKIADRFGRRKGLKYRLFDVTQAMLMRPDGHPSKYGHWPQAKVLLANDCVHWCLPGPVDSWNDFFLELLKREKLDSLV